MEPGAQCVATLRGHTDWINCITLLPDGRFVSGSDDRTLKIWDPSKEPGAQCVATLRGHTGGINCITLLPDGRFVSGSDDGTLKIWDPSKEPGAQCVATLRGHTRPGYAASPCSPMADSSPAPTIWHPENLGPG